MLLIAVMSACSAPSENSNTDNSNAAQPAASQNGADSSAAPNQQPAAEKVAVQAADQPVPQDVINAGPKLVVPVKRLNFGKQPKDKSLSRTFVIKNAGKAELKISAVEPS